jgi:hypothetical protein
MKITLLFLLGSLAHSARLALGAILFAGTQFVASSGLCTDPDPPSPSVTAVITGGGYTLSLASEDGIMGTVPLTVNQTREIMLQFSPAKAGQPLSFGLYDGGQIGSELNGVTAVPDVDSSSPPTLPMSFQAGEPGLHRVLIRIGAEEHIIRFHAK